MTWLRASIAVLAVAAPLAGCVADNTGDTGYRVVEADITYAPEEQRARQWNALNVALDRCHAGGFADAQLAEPPKTRCLEEYAGTCRRFTAHLSWDCIGMGYQPN